MRRVVWSDSARHDLKEAIRYIANDDPDAALVVRERIDRTVMLLSQKPIGHQGRVKNTYEKLVLKTSYILAYAISDSTITILHLIHTRRDWPEGQWPAEND